MIIRYAQAIDIASLLRLLVQLGYNQNESQIELAIKQHAQDGYQLLVAENEGEVIGFITLHWFNLFHRPEKLGRISAFCVDEGWRSKGIGIQLLDEAERIFKEKGCARIEVTSNARRTLAHEFYRNRGYKEDSRRFMKSLNP